MRRLSCAVILAMVFAGEAAAQGSRHRSVYLLGAGEVPIENDRFERGLPTISGWEEGQPFDRLPPWLQHVLASIDEMRELIAVIDDINEWSEQLRQQRLAAARDADEIRDAELIAGRYPARFAYALIAEVRTRRQFLVINVRHGATCGSAGCSIRFLARSGDRWQAAGEALGDAVSLGRGRSRGYPVFAVYSNGDSCLYRWDGSRFWHASGCRDW